jgi:transcriptional regulator with XRE-family HTH domain
MTLFNEIVEQIKARRKERGLTMVELAGAVKTIQPAISRGFNKEGGFSIEIIKKLCRYLDIYLSSKDIEILRMEKKLLRSKNVLKNNEEKIVKIEKMLKNEKKTHNSTLLQK